MKTVFLFTGGYTGESVISLKSAETFKKHLASDKYKVYTIVVSKGKWQAFYQETELEFNFNNCTIKQNGELVKPHVALIALHGPPGENGWLQGYLSIQDLPFTTGDTLSMAASFDKKMSVDIARQHQIPVAKSKIYKAKNLGGDSVKDLLDNFKLPVFIKPNASGSSLGVSKVKSQDEILPALQLAAKEGNDIMVEAFLEGCEITCGVFRHQGQLVALPPTEIRSHNDFFDYNAKYNKASDEITPAQVPDAWIENVQREAKKAYVAFNCRGVIRVDFMVNKDGIPHMIEPNTVPGMSEESIIPQQLQVAGIEISTMIDAIIDEALAH